MNSNTLRDAQGMYIPTVAGGHLALIDQETKVSGDFSLLVCFAKRLVEYGL